MKINETFTKTPTVNFNSLSNGTVFKISDEGPYYMKTDKFFPAIAFGVFYNAVKLENGEMCGVARDSEVIVFLEASMTPGKPTGTVKCKNHKECPFYTPKSNTDSIAP